MFGSHGYGYYNSYYNMYNSFLLLLIIAVILVIILMLTFLSKRNENKYTGFLKTLYDFLNFKKLTISVILKFIYLFLAIFLAFVSIMMLFNGGLSGVLTAVVYFVVSEVVLRIGFEFSMLLIVGVTNLIEINEKINNKREHEISFVEPDTDKYASIISEQANKVKDKFKEQSEKKEETKENVSLEEVEEESESEEKTEKVKKPRARKKAIEKEENENI